MLRMVGVLTMKDPCAREVGWNGLPMRATINTANLPAPSLSIASLANHSRFRRRICFDSAVWTMKIVSDEDHLYLSYKFVVEEITLVICNVDNTKKNTTINAIFMSHCPINATIETLDTTARKHESWNAMLSSVVANACAFLPLFFTLSAAYS